MQHVAASKGRYRTHDNITPTLNLRRFMAFPQGCPTKKSRTTPDREALSPEVRRRRLPQTTGSVRFRPLRKRGLSCPVQGDNDGQNGCKPRNYGSDVLAVCAKDTRMPRASKHLPVMYNHYQITYVAKTGVSLNEFPDHPAG